MHAPPRAAGHMPKPEKDKERGWRAVMPDEIGQQRFDDVVVQRRFTDHRYSRRWDPCQCKSGLLSFC